MKAPIIVLQLILCLTANLFPPCSALPESTAQPTRSLIQFKPRHKNQTLIFIVTQGKQGNRQRNKFPIIPPRLRMKSTTTKASTTTALPTTTPDNSTTTASDATSSTNRRTIRRNNINNIIINANKTSLLLLRQADIFEQSSSDTSQSIAWPVPRRPATNRRMWAAASNHHLSSADDEDDPGKRPVPKLLLPRPTRPAMYSLDGFVPKPSIIRVTTTEAPPHIKARYSNSVVVAKTAKRKAYGRQSLDEDEESDFKFAKRTQAARTKSVSRYTAFKRKGIPGKDYPVHSSIPTTDFDCASKPGAGMYADAEAGCQVWHMCPGNAPHRYSFMCPNGTIFNENRGVCDWWYNVSCLKLEAETPSPANTFRRRFGRDLD